MIFSNAAEAIPSPVSFFLTSELPPSEPVLSLSTKSWWKDRTRVAGLSSTNPAANLVKGKMYTKNNSHGLHMVITVSVLSDASPDREAATDTVQVSCKYKNSAAWKETIWWTDTWKTRLPEIRILLFWHSSALTDYSSLFSESHRTEAVGNPLCPSHCPSTRSLASVWAFLLLFCLGGFAPSFCFSGINRERKMTGDLRKGSI